jgi:deoxyadenosine/deoxycytidine kinase
MIISIEGNIGSGKSTILKELEKMNYNVSDVIFVHEPVSEWLNIKLGDKNALELFYENQKENSFWFQILAYITRLRNLLSILENNSKDKIIICERSIYTDKYVFAKMLYESSNINEMEWITYLYWFDTFKKQTKIDLILYVNTEPEECFNRIIKRNRVEEINKISKEYLINCHDKHTEWFNEKDMNTKIFRINGKDTVENIMKNVKHIICDIIISKKFE